MSDDLFRIYYDPTEIGHDGYPVAWHGVGKSFVGGYGVAIKDIVREEAGHRCVRCLHPYATGDGEWSACDEQCRHLGPSRYREIYRGDGEWSFVNLNEVGAFPGDGMYEDDQEGRRVKRYEHESQWRILTVHHLNGIKADCRWWNLVALCQRCHLTIQAKVRMERPWNREHSDWFKPYVAGYYAWAFLGEELDREQVAARMDELLALASPDQGLFPDVDRRY